MAGRDWTESELIRALALYYQIPFGAIDQRNPAIIALAQEMSRTSGSVGLKLANFASLDPSIVASGRRGMQNASAQDRRVFDVHLGRWDELDGVLSESVLGAIERRRTQIQRNRPARIADQPAVQSVPEISTAALALVTVRRGHVFFRNAILAAYRERCCITDVPVRELLRASHIVPWSKDSAARLDPTNGLCLNALHDAAFDRGLITFDETRRLVLSRRLREEMAVDVWKDWFGRYEGQMINTPERLEARSDALGYHREHVFVD